MRVPFIAVGLLVGVSFGVTAMAQPSDAYEVPRTADGHPDFQAVWATGFLTMLERPPGVEGLVAGPAQAQALVAGLRGGLPDNIDPDVHHYDFQELAIVKGERRTSIIVDPPDGRLPYTEAALALVPWAMTSDDHLDGPEDRPLEERCMQNHGFPPIRALPVLLPRQIFQTGDHVVILSEDSVGRRLIPLGGTAPDGALRSIEGYGQGRWEGDTLVVRNSQLRGEGSMRMSLGRPLLIGPDTVITERFTRVADDELFYEYTVEDDTFYTRPWSGELSMRRLDAPIYEYGCHEGNYSMTNALLGGRVADAAAEASQRE